MKALALLGIRLYQTGISSLLMSSCRFYPTCSHYGEAAIEKHGALKGGWITLRRLARCHPLGGCGYDPVP